ncbi:MAG: glutathione peroxidase [Bacteroidia bacterium]|nr:glutathione peroxidase [Bacteroidia bacterium]MDW8158045.1 glutathione peroxidase [Bacteroidia bacterium]
MRICYLVLGVAALLILGCTSQGEKALQNPLPAEQKAQSIYDFTMESIDGEKIPLSQYKGKVVLIVNVASKCGFTPQYEEIEAFYRKYKDKNVVVLGFPANNFLGQEPGTNAEIKQFCRSKYGVTFPMFAKISVKGDDMHPLYRYLTQTLGEDISWNFNKILVDKNGKPVKHFGSRTHVTEEEFLKAVENLLNT